ncbi:hypothetical protein QQ045_033623 [Rhodiola kirilowii]
MSSLSICGFRFLRGSPEVSAETVLDILATGEAQVEAARTRSAITKQVYFFTCNDP